MRTAVLLVSLLSLGAQQTASDREAWNRPVEPFRIAGHVYYVDVSGPDADRLENGEPNMPALRVDRRLADGDTVRLGGTTLTAVLFHCSTSVVDTLVGNQTYQAQRFRTALEKQR